jgi:hypothetical protein
MGPDWITIIALLPVVILMATGSDLSRFILIVCLIVGLLVSSWPPWLLLAAGFIVYLILGFGLIGGFHGFDNRSTAD